MSDLLLTFIATFGIVLIALLGILIGWLITGKPFTKGSCGRNLQQRKGEDCGNDDSCPLCSPHKSVSPPPKNTENDIADS